MEKEKLAVEYQRAKQRHQDLASALSQEEQQTALLSKDAKKAAAASSDHNTET